LVFASKTVKGVGESDKIASQGTKRILMLLEPEAGGEKERQIGGLLNLKGKLNYT